MYVTRPSELLKHEGVDLRADVGAVRNVVAKTVPIIPSLTV